MLRTDHHLRPRRRQAREVYRELCQDEDGNRDTVIVLEDTIGINTYRLEDGRAVWFIDGCEFETIQTGLMLSRCIQ